MFLLSPATLQIHFLLFSSLETEQLVVIFQMLEQSLTYLKIVIKSSPQPSLFEKLKFIFNTNYQKTAIAMNVKIVITWAFSANHSYLGK